MNYFEFLVKKIKEQLQAVFEEIPEFNLDLTEQEWDKYYE